MTNIVHKTTVARAAGSELTFVLSDETKDRVGDVIKADGWNLRNFQKNPIALFNHNSSFPIGFWKNVRTEGKSLLGDLTLAAEGTSDRIDEIRRLVDQGILRAVSVGFVPIKTEPLDKGNGTRFIQQELVETSLVSVPANPAAVQLAKSLNVSDDTIKLVFGEQAEADRMVVRGRTGGNAEIAQTRKPTTMTIAKQIEERQKSILDLQDQLQNQVSALDSAEDTEVATLAIEDLNARIEGAQKALDALRKAEASLVNNSQAIVIRDTDTGRELAQTNDHRRPWAAPVKQIKPLDQLVRMMVIAGVSKALNRDPVVVMRERYGDDRVTKAVFDIVTRAASAPAMTNVVTWAQELVTTAFLDMIDTLIPESVYPGLSAKGGRFSFGRNGIVSIPARTVSATVAGSFVGQGNPIPVRQGAFTATTLTVKKLAVITTFTREMAEHSTPQIEQVLRQAIMEDTSVSIDTILLDNNAATAIRPAGIRNGVSGLTPTAGGGLTALVADVKGLVGALITATAGHLRAPVWIMNPVQVLSIQFMTNANGMFIFAEEISRGLFRGYPLLVSTTVPATMVMLVDAADFFSATGDTPVFNASDQATLHMEDTTPLPIATGAQGSGVLATPTRSLFQTDSIGIRMTLDMNWALRRTGVVSWVTAVTW